MGIAPIGFPRGKDYNNLITLKEAIFVKKKFLSVLIALSMLLTLLPVSAMAANAGLDNFQKTLSYTTGQYSDVPAGNTFAENVKAGYEYGIMQGYGTTFGVGNNITRLASIIIACRLHCIYHNGANNIADIYTGTTQEMHLAYAADNGILCSFDDVSQNATRAEFAAILSSALPDAALAEKNTVDMYDIPDVTPDTDYADAIYRLYRAGIINGSDKIGTFYPESYITRGAACAIATRMCDVTLRKSVSLCAVGDEDTWFCIPGISNDSLTLSAATVLTCYFWSVENASLSWEVADPTVLSAEWEENWEHVSWKDTTLPVIDLTLTPLKNGETTLSVYSEEYPEVSVTIHVTVSGYTAPPAASMTDGALLDVMDHITDGTDYFTAALDEMSYALDCYSYDLDYYGSSATNDMMLYMAYSISSYIDAYYICEEYAELSNIAYYLSCIIDEMAMVLDYPSATSSNYFSIIMEIYNSGMLYDVADYQKLVLGELEALIY